MTFRRTDYIDLWRPQVTAAQSVGAQLVIGEFSSVSCSGKENVTNTFGQALCESLLWLPFRVGSREKDVQTDRLLEICFLGLSGLADTYLYSAFINITRLYSHQGSYVVTALFRNRS